MGLLDAEFKLATQQAKNYGTETDELGLKEEYLTQKIALQTQKVEEAKRAYDAAMSSQQASQKEIDELDKRLLNERTKLEQLNGSLQQTKEDTEKAVQTQPASVLRKDMIFLSGRVMLISALERTFLFS